MRGRVCLMRGCTDVCRNVKIDESLRRRHGASWRYNGKQKHGSKMKKM